MEIIEISYCFDLGEQRSEVFDLRLNARTLELLYVGSHSFPSWTALDFHQCPHCPLKIETHPHCPVAVSLVNVIEKFENVFSHDQVILKVITDNRKVFQKTTAQRGLSSLLGLLFATSGCPHTAFFKPMARFHLPLASEEETIFRAAGMYLMAQFFLDKEGKKNELGFDGLKRIYDNLHLLNMTVAQRIRSVTQADSSLNAVVLLDIFTDLMPFFIEDHLEEIRHLFDSYLVDSGNNPH